MLDLHRLRLLHLFAQHGTIAATANAIGYSPSAVSQQLAVLERESGAALLERSARSASLTEAGRRLAAHAAVVLSAVEAAEADLATLGSDLTGRLTIGVVPTTAALLAPALVALHRAHPGLDLVLRQVAARDAVAALHARELDVAVIDEWPPHSPATTHPDLHTVRLLRDPLLLAVPPTHPLADSTATIALSDRILGGQPLLCAPPDQPSRAGTDRLLAAASAQPAVRWEFDGLTTIATLVSTGAGLAVLPRLALLPGQPARPLAPPRHRRIQALIRTSSRRAPTVAAVLTALREATHVEAAPSRPSVVRSGPAR